MLLLNLLKQFLKSINTAKKCVYSSVKDKTTGDNNNKRERLFDVQQNLE